MLRWPTKISLKQSKIQSLYASVENPKTAQQTTFRSFQEATLSAKDPTKQMRTPFLLQHGRLVWQTVFLVGTILASLHKLSRNSS